MLLAIKPQVLADLLAFVVSLFGAFFRFLPDGLPDVDTFEHLNQKLVGELVEWIKVEAQSAVE